MAKKEAKMSNRKITTNRNVKYTGWVWTRKSPIHGYAARWVDENTETGITRQADNMWDLIELFTTGETPVPTDEELAAEAARQEESNEL